MKRTITTILILVAVAAGIYFILTGNKKKNEEKVEQVAAKNPDVVVRVAQVSHQEINDGFSVNGSFLANRTANIASEVSGQISALYVKEGSHVGAGQVIARLKGDKLNVNVANAQANLDNAQAALSRYEMAYKTGGVTALQLDQARLQVKNARAQVQSANLNSGDTTIRAKVGGIVNQKFLEVGSIVSPGTPIVEIVDISQVKLKVDVDEAMVARLALGQIVKVQPSVEEGSVDGRITFIAPASTGALKFPVEITVPNGLNKLKAGMYGTAIFNEGTAAKPLVIPRDAFVGSVSQNEVFVVRDNKAYMVKVQSGMNYGDKVEIVSGLKEGDVVVTSGQINLIDGTPVSVLK